MKSVLRGAGNSPATGKIERLPRARRRTNTYRAGPQISVKMGVYILGSVLPEVVRKIIMRKPANWGTGIIQGPGAGKWKSPELPGLAFPGYS